MFSLKRATAAQRAARKTPVQPSRVALSKARPKRTPRDTYTRRSHSHTVERAGVGHRHPNRLWHTFATEVRKRHGLEAYQALLGHATADVTRVSAERDDGLAERAASADGDSRGAMAEPPQARPIDRERPSMTPAERTLRESPVWLPDAPATVLPGGTVPSANTPVGSEPAFARLPACG